MAIVRTLIVAIGACFIAPSLSLAMDRNDQVRGIYMILPIDQDIEKGPALVRRAVTNPFVDGVYVRTRWSEAEPTPGSFDWSYLDAEIGELAARGKKVSIAVEAGTSAPEWLYKLGARSYSTVVEIPRQKDFCQPVELPIPWDGIFLRRWNFFIRALGQHLTAKSNLVLVKVTGIAYRTDETLLPRASGQTVRRQGKECTYPNDVANWRSQGYSSEKLIAAFHQILDNYGVAFPAQSLALMTGDNGFPPLDARGQIDTAAADQVELRLLEYGHEKLGSRFVGQTNSLTAVRAHSNLVAFGKVSAIAFQEAWPITNDPQCTMNAAHQPCDPLQTMQRTLEIVTSTKASYVELFKEDLANPGMSKLFEELHRTRW